MNKPAKNTTQRNYVNTGRYARRRSGRYTTSEMMLQDLNNQISKTASK